MAGIDNLIPNSERTPEELREMTSKGGHASVKARREKKALRERLKELVEMKVPGSEMTFGEAILKAQIERALADNKNSARAAEWIVDNVEGKLKDTIDHQGAVILNFDKKLENL